MKKIILLLVIPLAAVAYTNASSEINGNLNSFSGAAGLILEQLTQKVLLARVDV